MTTSTSSDPLAQPWLPMLRWASIGVIALALVAMAISLIVVVSQTPLEAPTTRTVFGQEAPAQRSRLEHDPVAWVPVAALGTQRWPWVHASSRIAGKPVSACCAHNWGYSHLRSVRALIDCASAGWADRRASQRSLWSPSYSAPAAPLVT